MPLEVLHIRGTPIRDYSLLRTLPLKVLELDYDPKRHAELLRAIPTLKIINFRPAAEVLNGVAEGSDRDVAEWVFARRGTVRLKGKNASISSSAQLPKEGFALTAVSLFGQRELNDADLGRLTPLTDLQELVLYHTPITDAGMVHIGALKGLTLLDLGDTRVTDAGLNAIKGLRKLTNLSLHYTAVSGPWLENLKNFEHLAVLNLNGAVDDAGLKRVAQCTSLRTHVGQRVGHRCRPRRASRHCWPHAN